MSAPTTPATRRPRLTQQQQLIAARRMYANHPIKNIAKDLNCHTSQVHGLKARLGVSNTMMQCKALDVLEEIAKVQASVSHQLASNNTSTVSSYSSTIASLCNNSSNLNVGKYLFIYALRCLTLHLGANHIDPHHNLLQRNKRHNVEPLHETPSYLDILVFCSFFFYQSKEACLC